MHRYIKKPVEIEAVRVMRGWFDGPVPNPDHISSPEITTYPKSRRVEITTLEGIMVAREGDWIIKGVRGEYYPCKDDIFRKSYNPANENASLYAGWADGAQSKTQ